MSEAAKIKIAFDKGNNSQKNLRLIAGHEYIGSLVPSNHPDLTSIGLQQYTKTYKGFKVYEKRPSDNLISSYLALDRQQDTDRCIYKRSGISADKTTAIFSERRWLADECCFIDYSP